MQIRFDLKIVLVLIIFCFTKQIEIYILLMLFTLLHELGHILIGISLKFKPKILSFKPFGISVSFEKYYYINRNKPIIHKILVASGGIFMNILLIFLLLIPIKFIPYSIKEKMIIINVIIILFNLIPIYPLDGGRILKNLLKIFFESKVVNKYSYEVSNITIIVLTGISSIAIYYFKNIAILFIIMYLWQLVFIENKKYKLNNKIISIIEKNKHISIENF